MKEIKDFTEKAAKFLSTAEQALNTGDYDSCVSRSYYAMFFMAEAALFTKNLIASSHKGVITLFGEHFIKTKILDRNLGKALNFAYDERIVGDYGIGFEVTFEQARNLMETARYFVMQLRNYLDKWMENQ